MLAKLRNAQLRSQAFWLFYISASFICFSLLLSASLAATKSPTHAGLITVIGIALSTALVAVTLNLVHNHKFLDSLASR